MSKKRISDKSKVLRELYFAKSMSCADLSNQLNRSLPLITKLINELLEEETIVEVGYAASTGGRRPQMYAIKADTLYIVAVSMDQLFTRIALVDTENQFVGEISQIELPLTQNPHALEKLVEAIGDFLIFSKVDKSKIVGVGIGMPGFVDVEKGINYSFFEIIGSYTNLPRFISSSIDLPVFIDNDSSLIALAELRFGAAIGKKNAMVVNVGWGVGLGMILNGNIYRGELGFAGEFSHIPLFTNNKLCSCGKSGCLETETSLLVLIENAKEQLRLGRISKIQEESLAYPEEAYGLIVKYAFQGDRLAVELISDIAYKIGRGVAILIHLLNPELIVLSGRGSRAGKIWQAPIQQALNEYCIPRLAQQTRVQISELGFETELIGAAALVMENLEYFDISKLEVTDFE
jgi:predicted NBD/HSP70 family sugar kinase